MKVGLFVIGALILGAILATWFGQDPGRVLLVFRGYTIQMSVPVLIVVLVLLYFLIRLVIRVLRAPRKLGEAAGRIRARQANKHFNRGLIEIAEGNWSRGERLLTRGVRQSETPLLNYLSAARAAQKQGAHDRRDNWLKMAYEQTPAAATAVLLTQAELQIAHRQYEEALATLRKLEESAPNHVQGLTLLARIYDELGDWENLKELVPRLRKRKAGTPERLADLEARVYVALLEQESDRNNLGKLRSLWQEIPKASRTNTHVLRAYVRATLTCGAHAEAEKAITKALKNSWDEGLVHLYGSVETEDTARQLNRVEAWLKERDEDPVLLLTAGRLSMRNELWGKARSYLETSLALRPSPEAYQLFGRLLEHLGEIDNAGQAYRSGLALAADVSGGLPALEGPEERAGKS